MRTLFIAVLGIALASALAIAATKERQAEGPAARLCQAPAAARLLKNPVANDPRAVAAGQRLFLRHCSECHSRDGRGLGRAANLHSQAVQEAPAGSIFWAIRNGRLRKGMPSWSQLPDREIWQLVTFVRNLKEDQAK